MKDRSKIQEIPKDLKYPKTLESYLQELLEKSASAHEVAQKARAEGYDPAKKVEMEIANDIPSVVEAMVGPKGVAKRIRELMRSGKEGEEISLTIAKEIAEGRFGQKDIDKKANQAVKTALSIATGGITAAPLEGVTKVKVREDRHLAIHYAGPIRSAGGTETALSVLIADVVRRTLGLKKYEIPKKVKERIIEETILYDRRRNLQFPVDKEKLAFVLEHLPVEINGEGSTNIKVSGPYRRVENVDTASARTGVVLVVNDGLIGKAKKLLRIISKLHVEGWEWLRELKSIGKGHKTNEEEKAGGSDAYMEDIIVGRPVFSSPSQIGGFRLRYGRARNTGLAALGVHPATMHLLDDFLATGTQIKTERPGKAAVTVPVDSIMPPIVRLNNGNVIKVNKVKEAREIKDKIDKILFLGDILSAVGEFFENNHKILPSPIVEEWWSQELENAIKQQGWNKKDLSLDELIRKGREDPEFSFELTEKIEIPLHPQYTYFWRNINGEELKCLKTALEEKTGNDLKYSENKKTILEKLFVPHKLNNSKIKLNDRDLKALEKTLSPIKARNIDESKNGLEIVNEKCNIKQKYPYFVGARMGRPEKAKPRKLKPPVHLLFPMGKSGAKNRSITKAARKGEESKVEMQSKYCPDCKSLTFKHRCPECGKEAVPVKICGECDKHFLNRERCPSCNSSLKAYKTYEINFNELLQSGMETLDISSPPKVKGVKGVISKEKIPEPIEKGILRGKEGVYVFKDGTARFDATDLPLTHFKPKEINSSVETLRKLGYKKDVEGKELEDPNQLVEIKPQDIIISEDGLKYLYKIAKFVDGLLTKFYDLAPYYEVSEPKDLMGKLVIGMAPHTSSGIVGRIIGTTKSHGIYSHPYWHAAKRRNCFHPNTKLWIKEKGKWTYVRIEDFVEKYLDPQLAKRDSAGTLFQEVDQEIYVPSIDMQGKQTVKKVEAVSRHQPTDHMLKITTRSGRVIKVTPAHSMVKWDQGKIEKLEAQELSPEDKIPIPKRMNIQGEEKQIDLLEKFINTSQVPNEKLMIRGIGEERIKSLLKGFTGEEKYLSRSAEKLGVNRKTLHNWIRRKSFPSSFLIEVMDKHKLLEDISNDITIALKRDNVEVKRMLTIDEEFASVLGYYTAEGFTRQQENQYYQTTICTPEKQARKEVIGTFKEKLGVDAYKQNKWKVTVSSKLVSILFKKILNLGGCSKEKRIPRTLFESPQSCLKEFLASYFSGDGSASRNRIEIRANTVSDELKQDLTAALKTYGITPKIYKEKRVPKSGAVDDFYRGDTPEYEIWTIKITSGDVAKFDENIGFDLKRKDRRVSRVLEEKQIRGQRRLTDKDAIWLDEIKSIETIKPNIEYTYCLTVEDTHTLVANGVYTGQCDGDEDAVILLLDGLLNFSKKFLPESRGGKMDAPLVIRTILKPEVVDAEVFNIEINDTLPIEFYRKSQNILELNEASSIIEKIEDHLGTEKQYFDFPYNIPTENINQGPTITSYKKLKNMEEKANKQLNTVSRISAVETKKIASKLLSDHILPDIMGNLRAFGRQRFRCTQCNRKFTIYPLQGKCPNCGGDVHLTVFRGTITKYLSLAEKIIEEYDVTNYIRSRYEILKKTDLTSLKKVNILGNAIKKAEKQRKRSKKDIQKSKAIKKEKKIKIEDYL